MLSSTQVLFTYTIQKLTQPAFDTLVNATKQSSKAEEPNEHLLLLTLGHTH